MIREEPSVAVWININVGLIIDYKKSGFDVEKVADALNDFNIDTSAINMINTLVESAKNATSSEKLIIRYSFNISPAADIDMIIKRYRLFKDL